MTLFSRWQAWRAQPSIAHQLARIEGKVDRLLMDENTLKQKLDKLATDVAGAVSSQQAATADLKAQIAALQAGEPVSQDQLDALGAKVDAIDAAIAPLVPAA